MNKSAQSFINKIMLCSIVLQLFGETHCGFGRVIEIICALSVCFQVLWCVL